jgi:hypothetical protein
VRLHHAGSRSRHLVDRSSAFLDHGPRPVHFALGPPAGSTPGPRQPSCSQGRASSFGRSQPMRSGFGHTSRALVAPEGDDEGETRADSRARTVRQCRPTPWRPCHTLRRKRRAPLFAGFGARQSGVTAIGTFGALVGLCIRAPPAIVAPSGSTRRATDSTAREAPGLQAVRIERRRPRRRASLHRGRAVLARRTLNLAGRPRWSSWLVRLLALHLRLPLARGLGRCRQASRSVTTPVGRHVRCPWAPHSLSFAVV